jgi:hypothetical protein
MVTLAFPDVAALVLRLSSRCFDRVGKVNPAHPGVNASEYKVEENDHGQGDAQKPKKHTCHTQIF